MSDFTNAERKTRNINKEKLLQALDYEAYYKEHLESASVSADGKEITGLCPIHGESNPSFSANLETGMFYCHSCQAKGDVITFHQEVHGVDFQQALVELAEFNVRNAQPATATQPSGMEAEYSYKDEQGNLVFQVVRYAPKAFRQRRPDENGGWIWNVNGVPMLPYRLDEVIAADLIFICEGEKDVDRLVAEGLTATCSPMGAGKWRDEYSEHFVDKEVIILPDNDDAGRKHAQMVAKSVYGKAASVRIINLPGLPEKGDVSDWLNSGGTWDEMVAIIGATDPWTSEDEPDATPTPQLLTGGDILKLHYEDNPIIEGLLDEGESLLICGQSGIGKSLLTFNMSLNLAGTPGGLLWGQFPIKRKATSLILQSEVTGKAIHSRLTKMCSETPAFEKAKNDLIFPTRGDSLRVAGALTDPEFQKFLLDALKDSKADVLFVDPLISFHGTDENNNAEMRRTLDCLTRIQDEAGVTVVLIHHVGKSSGKNGVFSGRGASAIGDWAANILLLEPDGKDELGHAQAIKVTHQKARNYGKVPPFHLEIGSDLVLRPTDGVMSSAEEGLKQLVELLEGMGGSCDKQSDLIAKAETELGMSRSSIQRAIKAGVASGALNKVDGKGRSVGYEIVRMPEAQGPKQ